MQVNYDPISVLCFLLYGYGSGEIKRIIRIICCMFLILRVSETYAAKQTQVMND